MIHTAHPSPQPKRHLDRISRIRTGDRRVSLYFTMRRPFPPQNCPFPWGSRPPSNTWFLGPTRVQNPNGISIGSAVFAGLTSVRDRQTDRPTDHATRSVTIGRIYVRSTAMRPKNCTELSLSVSARQHVSTNQSSSETFLVSVYTAHLCRAVQATV